MLKTVTAITLFAMIVASSAYAGVGAGSTSSGPGNPGMNGTQRSVDQIDRSQGYEGGKPWTAPKQSKKTQSLQDDKKGGGGGISGNGGKVPGRDDPNKNPAGGTNANGG